MWKEIKLAVLVTMLLETLATDPAQVEIAPGVIMPMINHGSGNQTLWLEMGGRGMDTAYDYGPDNQGSLAMAVRSGLASRSEVFITTKIPCCPSGFFGYATSRCADASVNINSPEQEIAKGLELEGITEADLLLLHWPCDKMEDSIAVYKTMEKALAKGLTRAIGVSNFNASALDTLMKATTIKPAVTQNSISIGNHFNAKMGSDEETLKYCKEHGITVAAWSPLGGTSDKGTSIFNNTVVSAVAKSHGKSNAQVALRWLVQQGIAPVTAGENAKHLREDLDIFGFNLTQDEMTHLSTIGEESVALVV